MAKKTRTELSTLALNTNLPDNTTELITPTTERAQLTDERESVVNYKDDLGGLPNAGKFLTVAIDGESLTMVDEPSGVPDWVTFQTAAVNLMKLLSGTTSVQIQFRYDDAGVDTIGARITFDGTSKGLRIVNDFYQTEIGLSNQVNFVQGGDVKLRIETTGDLTHNADIMALNAQQAFGSNPLYTLKFQGKVTGPSGGSFTFEEFANIKGGKENATENDKAGYLSFTTGIADGTLTERLRISSGGRINMLSTEDISLNIQSNRNVSGDVNIYSQMGGNTNNTSSFYFIGQNTAEGNRILIYGNGNVVNANGSYGSISDIKVKENVVDASPKLDDLLKVKVRNYNLIGDENKQIGVVAQELEEVFPSMIDESPDYEEVEVEVKDEEGNIVYKTEQVLVSEEVLDEDGNIIEEAVYETITTTEPEMTTERVETGTTTKSVKYSVFVPMLIKGLQEQQTIIEDLKARIEKLEL